MTATTQESKDSKVAGRRAILKTLAIVGLSGIAHAVMARGWSAPLFAVITLDDAFFVIPDKTGEELSISVEMGAVEPIPDDDASGIHDSERLLGLDPMTGVLSRVGSESTPIPTHKSNCVVQFVSRVGEVNVTTSEMRFFADEFSQYDLPFVYLSAYSPRGFTQNQTGGAWRGSYNVTSYFSANSTTVMTQLRHPKNATVWTYSKNVTTVIPWSTANTKVTP